MKFWPAIIALVSLATSQGAPEVRVTGVAGQGEDEPAVHVVGGKAVELALQLSSREAERVSIRASLYQVATSVAAPIARDLPVADALALDGTAIRPQKFTLTPPAVLTATVMEVRFTAKTEREETWRAAGTARLIVHPPDTLAQIRKQSSAAANRAGVELLGIGESPQLKAVLREAGLDFQEAEAVSDSAKSTLHLIECSAAVARDLMERSPAPSRILLFIGDSTSPPGAYWTERATGFEAKITLPVLTHFAQRPDRQTFLLSLFQQAFRAFPDQP